MNSSQHDQDNKKSSAAETEEVIHLNYDNYEQILENLGCPPELIEQRAKELRKEVEQNNSGE